jgi:hypothetical protein
MDVVAANLALQEHTEHVINQWVVIDKEVLVCHILTDEDIVESVIN